MSRWTTTPLVHKITCDKRSCSATLKVPNLPEWGTELAEHVRRWGWSRWVSRSSFDYCPDHSPSAAALNRTRYGQPTMRRVL